MRKRHIFYGWWIVLAGLMVGGFGSAAHSYGFGAFFRSILAEFGWSRAATAGAFSASRFLGIIALLIIGPLIDRLGPRRVMLTGVVIASVGFMTLSLVDSLWMLYLAYGVLLALGFTALSPLAPLTAVANWFKKRRCLVLTLVVLLSGVGGIVVADGGVWVGTTPDSRFTTPYVPGFSWISEDLGRSRLDRGTGAIGYTFRCRSGRLSRAADRHSGRCRWHGW